MKVMYEDNRKKGHFGEIDDGTVFQSVNPNLADVVLMKANNSHYNAVDVATGQAKFFSPEDNIYILEDATLVLNKHGG